MRFFLFLNKFQFILFIFAEILIKIKMDKGFNVLLVIVIMSYGCSKGGSEEVSNFADECVRRISLR